MISVIVCTYNRAEYIYECLSRLSKNVSSCVWEIILINNNSTDDTAKECERFVNDCCPTNYSYFVEARQGLSYARNRGIKEARGEWLVFLDDDAFVEADYIDNLQRDLSAHPDAGAFGGRIIPKFEGTTPNWLNPWSMSFVSALDKGDTICLFEAGSYPTGANMGISRNAIEKCGLFNTELGRNGGIILLGGEEKDIFNRINTAGFSIYYFPDITVRHIIPEHRTTREFIARLGFGIGVSERLRTKKIGSMAYLKRLLAEAVKWGGTITLWCYYWLTHHPAKGNILIHFRTNVSKGLLYRG